MNSEFPFVAINTIHIESTYTERFELLFASRAHAIDKLPGFLRMHVLKPSDGDGAYLIMSFWNSEDDFKAWTLSPEFLEGHKRGFADLELAKKEGNNPPMRSSFKTYNTISR